MGNYYGFGRYITRFGEYNIIVRIVSMDATKCMNILNVVFDKVLIEENNLVEPGAIILKKDGIYDSCYEINLKNIVINGIYTTCQIQIEKECIEEFENDDDAVLWYEVNKDKIAISKLNPLF